MKKVLVTGGNSRFCSYLKKIKTNFNFIYTNKTQLNILDVQSIKKNLNKIKPNYVLHLAGLSRPMSIHDKDIAKSINLNIIGTSNLVTACSAKNIKFIYFSTGYVYQGTKGNYKEEDPVLPWNNYAWSKLGGECAVQMYKNSLILRVTMTEYPFLHKKAYANVKTNFIYHKDLAKIFIKVLNKKGVINLGGPIKSVFNFVKNKNKKIKKIYSKGEFPLNPSMNIKKLNLIIKKK